MSSCKMEPPLWKITFHRKLAVVPLSSPCGSKRWEDLWLVTTVESFSHKIWGGAWALTLREVPKCKTLNKQPKWGEKLSKAKWSSTHVIWIKWKSRHRQKDTSSQIEMRCFPEIRVEGGGHFHWGNALPVKEDLVPWALPSAFYNGLLHHFIMMLIK